jgi:hypothetical protein
MFRRDAFVAVGGYRERSDGYEDVDLFFRLGRVGKVLVLPEALYSYRYHSLTATLGMPDDQRMAALRQRDKELGAKDTALTARRAESYATKAAMSVWAGERPRRHAPISGAILRGSWGHRLRAMLYASWGNLHPRSLRTVLASYVRLRDRVASAQLEVEEPIEWHFG